jgi:hypothetical protein
MPIVAKLWPYFCHLLGSETPCMDAYKSVYVSFYDCFTDDPHFHDTWFAFKLAMSMSKSPASGLLQQSLVNDKLWDQLATATWGYWSLASSV